MQNKDADPHAKPSPSRSRVGFGSRASKPGGFDAVQSTARVTAEQSPSAPTAGHKLAPLAQRGALVQPAAAAQPPGKQSPTGDYSSARNSRPEARHSSPHDTNSGRQQLLPADIYEPSSLGGSATASRSAEQTVRADAVLSPGTSPPSLTRKLPIGRFRLQPTPLRPLEQSGASSSGGDETVGETLTVYNNPLHRTSPEPLPDTQRLLPKQISSDQQKEEAPQLNSKAASQAGDDQLAYTATSTFSPSATAALGRTAQRTATLHALATAARRNAGATASGSGAAAAPAGQAQLVYDEDTGMLTHSGHGAGRSTASKRYVEDWSNGGFWQQPDDAAGTSTCWPRLSGRPPPPPPGGQVTWQGSDLGSVLDAGEAIGRWLSLLGLFAQGLLGGLSLLTLFMTYVLYSGNGLTEFLHYYSPIAQDLNRTYYTLITLSMVTVCARMAFDKLNDWQPRELYLRMVDWAGMLLYVAAYVCSLVITPIDDQLTYEYARDATYYTQPLPSAFTARLAVWNGCNLVRVICSGLAWLLMCYRSSPHIVHRVMQQKAQREEEEEAGRRRQRQQQQQAKHHQQQQQQQQQQHGAGAAAAQGTMR